MAKFRRIICFTLTVIILLSVVVSAEDISPWASRYFGSYEAYLYRTSSTSFEVWFEVTATGRMDELGASVIKVQRSSDGSNWNTVRTYKKDMYPQLTCDNTIAHADCVSYTSVEPGFYYRAYVEFYATKGTGTGYLSYYTARL